MTKPSMKGRKPRPRISKALIAQRDAFYQRLDDEYGLLETDALIKFLGTYPHPEKSYAGFEARVRRVFKILEERGVDMSPKEIEEEESPEIKKAKHLIALLNGGHWDELARLAKEDRDKKEEEEE